MVDYVPLTKADLGSFDKEAVKHVTRAVELGWVGRVSSKGHCIMLAPDGETTMRVPPIMDAPGHGARNARAALRRWERANAPEEGVKKEKRDYAIPIHNTVGQAVTKETVEQVKEAVSPKPKEAPMEEEKDEAGGGFEMYVPPVKVVTRQPAQKPHVTIMQVGTIYLSKKVMEILGKPDRVNISVDVDAAEMLIWKDKNGHMSVRRRDRAGKELASGYVPATDLINHFNLPKQTRWTEVSGTSAPGRIIVTLTDETPEEKE